MSQMRGILDLFSNGFQNGHSFAKIVLQIHACGSMFFDIWVAGTIDCLNQIFDRIAKQSNVPARIAARASQTMLPCSRSKSII